MRILLCLIMNALLLIHKTDAGDQPVEGLAVRGDPTDQVKEKADSAVQDVVPNTKNSSDAPMRNYTLYEIKDSKGQMLARLNLTLGEFYAELVKTKKSDTGLIGYVMDGYMERKYGRFNFSSEPEITATKNVTLVKDQANKEYNATVLQFSFSFTESVTSDNVTSLFNVETAKLDMTVEWGDYEKLVRPDYWNITAIKLTMKAKVNGSSDSWDLDLTPQFSYNKPTIYSMTPACTAGYGICAPLGLCWSCGDQVLSTNDLSSLGDNKTAVLWHLPGMLLEPEWGNTVNVTGNDFRFSANWDCDPLIPLSIWVGLLITLFLVSILAWGIQMLTDLQVPNKWDDPKKPGIHVPQAE